MITSTITAEQMFRDFLESNGHPLGGNINYDSSKFHYFRCPHGGKMDARYKFHSDGIPSGYLKCWRCGIEDNFCSKQKENVSSEEWQTHIERLAETKRQEAIITQQQYAECAALAKTVFSVASESNFNEYGYLSKKKVQSYGLRVIEKENEYTQKAKCYKGTVLVPGYNSDLELVNLERIYLDNSQNKYQKRPLTGAQRSGVFYMLGEVPAGTNIILIAEGYSTAATVYEALGYPTAITFNCGNIMPVTKILREKYPKIQLLIIADDDRWTENPLHCNSGEKAAKKACAEVSNVSYVLPNFSVLGMSEEKLAKLDSPPTDFNDLFTFLLDKNFSRSDALAEVAQQIIPKPLPHTEILGKLIDKITPIDFRGKAKLDDEEKLKNNHYQIIVVESLLELAQTNNWGICKHLDFVYLFNGTYWKLLDQELLKRVLGDIALKMGVEEYKAKYFNFRDNLYKQFASTAYLPTPEQNNDSICINLKNGTFEIQQDGNICLREFDQNDFLIYQLPFEYRPEAEAPLFHQYLNKVLPEKRLHDILAEYLGYVFIHSSTLKLEKTLLLYGTGANGKSVFYEVVKNLLGEDNISAHSLQSLTDDTGYSRAMIANKLVNYASEINGRLEASIFKQLVSGEPVEARLPYGRPFTITKYAKLIFNCNELPKDVEQTEAYFRRFLIIPFEVTIPEAEQDKQLAQKIVSNELSGVFNWVLDGLRRLLKQKNFTECTAIHRMREQYEQESDSVKTFINEENYRSDNTGYIQIKFLYNEYKTFCSDNGFKPVNKTNFIKRLDTSKPRRIEIKRMTAGMVAYLIKEAGYKDCG